MSYRSLTARYRILLTKIATAHPNNQQALIDEAKVVRKKLKLLSAERVTTRFTFLNSVSW